MFLKKDLRYWGSSSVWHQQSPKCLQRASKTTIRHAHNELFCFFPAVNKVDWTGNLFKPIHAKHWWNLWYLSYGKKQQYKKLCLLTGFLSYLSYLQ